MHSQPLPPDTRLNGCRLNRPGTGVKLALGLGLGLGLMLGLVPGPARAQIQAAPLATHPSGHQGTSAPRPSHSPNDASLLRAQTWAEQGQTAPALAATEQALLATPEAAPWLLLQAGLWMQSGREADARQRLLGLSLAYPELAEAENNLAVLDARQGAWEAALGHLQSARTAHPGCALTWRNLSRVHEALSQQAHAQARRLGAKPISGPGVPPLPGTESSPSPALAGQMEWAYRFCD